MKTFLRAGAAHEVDGMNRVHFHRIKAPPTYMAFKVSKSDVEKIDRMQAGPLFCVYKLEYLLLQENHPALVRRGNAEIVDEDGATTEGVARSVTIAALFHKTTPNPLLI